MVQPEVRTLVTLLLILKTRFGNEMPLLAGGEAWSACQAWHWGCIGLCLGFPVFALERDVVSEPTAKPQVGRPPRTWRSVGRWIIGTCRPTSSSVLPWRPPCLHFGVEGSRGGADRWGNIGLGDSVDMYLC